MVVYSITMTTKAEDIFLEVYPAPDDPIVQTTVDKFYKTDLDSILKEKGIKTVVITGTAANGAVLHTAVGAALNGYQVVLPVDGMSATEPYAEQYTAFHMLNSPGTRNKAVLTKVGLITF
jgi:nicotinamidase-related amidase